VTSRKKVVTPAKAGLQCFCNHLPILDTGFRRYDVNDSFSTFAKAPKAAC